MCIVCKQMFDKRDLVRIVRTTEGEILVDLSGKLNGRGAYIKKDVAILEKAIKTKMLERHLEIEIPGGVYEELRNIIEK